MPAPVVYVLAFLGTVGAAIAFKEFVYEPHIAPAIDKWKAEYQAAREARRRREQFSVLQDVDDMQMSEPRKRGMLSDKYSDDESDDGKEDCGKTATTSSHSVMRDGLLIRRPVPDKGDVELDNLVAHEVNEWRNHLSGQVLRQRKNVSEYAMDQSIQPIPYRPLSPSRTHVIIDSSAPSPSTTAHSRLPTPPPEAKPQQTGTDSPKVVQHVPTSPKHASPLRDAVYPSDQGEYEPQILSSSSSAPPSAPSPSITSPLHAPTHHPYPQVVPSLSQSYPQDLDYEHDLELLSPPSSRSESPFFMATRSPPARGFGRPTSSLGSQSTSDLSFAVVSPRSPLRMGLGNDSYDAISPVPDFQTLSGSRVTDSPARLNPNLSASASAHGEPSSEHATPSSQASSYLSFEEEEESSVPQPYAHLAGLGMSGSAIPSSSTSHQQTLVNHQSAGLHYSLVQGPYNTFPGPPNTTQLERPDTGTLSPSASASFAAKDGSPGLLLSATQTLFPVPPRSPYTPSPPAHPEGVAIASHSANAAIPLPAGERDSTYFRPSSRTQTHEVSDSELSDLDFISDYAPSESDMGNESDASWGVLGHGRR